MPLMTFAEAIEDSAQYSKRHLLLGNGFSIACRADIFHYGSLFAQADFTQVPEVEAVFAALGTQDFEQAIRSLENAARILPPYIAHGDEAIAKMLEHAEALKEILLQTIAGNHPHVPPDIPDEKFWTCRQFLANFLAGNKAGTVFTLNYDLLLYWTLMHDDMPFDDPINLAINDGFGNDEDEPDAEYVVWQGETNAHSASVMFLHGALHLFDSGKELQKYTWIRKGVPLIEQARAAIARDAYPLFVAEGTSAQKKAKIRHNAYLYQGFKQFTANVQQGKHCLFVYGHSLAENDDHILKRIGKGRFRELYVGIYGDPQTDDNQRIMNRAHELAAMRPDRWPLEVAFYDAASANVWGA
ncbi:DUF4917 family protein [Croceicoccus pelagius]|uniref:DUF4917 domain-containing protein n=1 Tax=Croceicoccus pelagius TaxID=1703341 RepID=A0A916Y8W2_9SPHN|nr:DUF4917 family protein [Croceicoccus pelagius]GGD34675.1 DUF4917 domain-containing protein [Croceicoccus pelagius]